MVSQRLLDDLKNIIREDYGIELEDAETFDFADRLLRYSKMLFDIEQGAEQEHLRENDVHEKSA